MPRRCNIRERASDGKLAFILNRSSRRAACPVKLETSTRDVYRVLQSMTSLARTLLLVSAGGLALVAGPILYLLPHLTYVLFAFTFAQNLTPVFLGANYLASLAYLPASTSQHPALARVYLPAIIVVGTTELLATLLHLPSLNQSSPAAWVWMAVYVISPIAAILLLIQNVRSDRRDAATGIPLPRYFAPVTRIFAAIDLALGLALFIFPRQAGVLAAWSVTPLTARLIAGWHLSSAALFWMMSRQRTFDTARFGLLATMLASTLLWIGAALHFRDFNGHPLAIAFYLLILVLLDVFCVWVWLRAGRTRVK